MKFMQPFRMALFTLCIFILRGSVLAEKGGGFIVYPAHSGSNGPAVFSHQSHGPSGAGFACSQCHADTTSKGMAITMDDIRRGKACGSCHDGNTKGPRVGLAAASVHDCSACHMPAADIIIKLNRMDPVAFSHLRHLAADSGKKISRPTGFSCEDCHPIPFEPVAKRPVGMEIPHETGGCAYCHSGRERDDGNPPAFAATAHCLTCHKPS